MSRLPAHVSSLQPLEPATALDGERPYDPHARGEPLAGYQEVAGFPLPPESSAEVYLLPQIKDTRLPHYHRRFKSSPVLIARADPRCWAVARALCVDLERLSVAKDGSVTIHNHPWQAVAARKKEMRR